MIFKDRFHTGELLAEALGEYKDQKNAIILAIPRGALQIGKVLHDKLKLPLDIIITKKISHPRNEEYAIGAVGPWGEKFVDLEAVVGVSSQYIEEQTNKLAKIIQERYARYRGSRPPPELKNKTVIIIDDGIATGNTIIAALHFIRKQQPVNIVVAVPVAPSNSIQKIRSIADKVICLYTTDTFFAIGQFYENFMQVEDDEAIEILKKCWEI